VLPLIGCGQGRPKRGDLCSSVRSSRSTMTPGSRSPPRMARAASSTRSSASIPIRIWARRAILMSAIVIYAGNRFPEAFEASERFISLHSRQQGRALRYYLKSVSLYGRSTTSSGDHANRGSAHLIAGFDSALSRHEYAATRGLRSISRATIWPARNDRRPVLSAPRRIRRGDSTASHRDRQVSEPRTTRPRRWNG